MKFAEVTTAEVIRESQTDRVVFGDFAYAYADYLDEHRRAPPRHDRPQPPARELPAGTTWRSSTRS